MKPKKNLFPRKCSLFWCQTQLESLQFLIEHMKVKSVHIIVAYNWQTGENRHPKIGLPVWFFRKLFFFFRKFDFFSKIFTTKIRLKWKSIEALFNHKLHLPNYQAVQTTEFLSMCLFFFRIFWIRWIGPFSALPNW